MGASGNLCTAVLVSVDENTKATGVVTANVSSYRPSGKGLREGNASWSLIFESFEF